MEKRIGMYTPEDIGRLFGAKKPEFQLIIGEIVEGSPLEDRMKIAQEHIRNLGSLSRAGAIAQLERRGYSYQEIEPLKSLLGDESAHEDARYGFYDFHQGETGYYYLQRRGSDGSLSLAVGEAPLDKTYPYYRQPSTVIFSSIDY